MAQKMVLLLSTLLSSVVSGHLSDGIAHEHGEMQHPRLYSSWYRDPSYDIVRGKKGGTSCWMSEMIRHKLAGWVPSSRRSVFLVQTSSDILPTTFIHEVEVGGEFDGQRTR